MTQRGFVLTFAMISAILIAIVCMALLAMAANEAHRARFHRLRAQAVYASESGITWAQQQMDDSLPRRVAGVPNSCWSGGNLSIPPYTVVVTLIPNACPGCPGTPCATPRQIRTRVTY